VRLIGREQEAGRAALLAAVPALLAVATVLSHGDLRVGLMVATVVAGIAWCLVWWPELLVMAYMFTGNFAFEPRLAPGGLNVSFNQVMFVGVLFIILLHAGQVMSTGRSRAGLGLIGFSVALAVGMLWTLGPTYGSSKVIRTLGVVLPSMLATIGLLAARRSIVPLFGAIWAIGFGLNLAAWARYPASLDEARRLTALGSGPNVFGRTVGLTVLVSVFLVIWLVKKQNRTRLENVLLVGAVASALVTTPGFVLAQARGPSLAMVTALGLFALLSLGGSWRRVVAIALLALGAWLLVDYTMSNLVLASRFDLSNEWNMGSIVYRKGMLLETVDLVGRHPWMGVGTGGWPVEIFGIDDRRYPHHFFAEVAAELGLPAATAMLLLFVSLPLLGFRVWRRLDDGPQSAALLAAGTLFVYFLVNIQISGDSVDNRLIWILLAALEAATVKGAASCSPTAVAAATHRPGGGRPRWPATTVGQPSPATLT
jgi:O-antigen ligase